jgi:outer membrane protein OmpA-like peptidoglycan-associated protein
VDPKDLQRSNDWAIAGIASIGCIVNWYPFDLVNRVSGRAHLMHVVVGGLNLLDLPTASASPIGYTNFRTQSNICFSDFDGVGARITAVNIGIAGGYGITILTLWEGAAYVTPLLIRLAVNGWGAMVPGAVFGHGSTAIQYGLGNPMGLVSMLLATDDFPVEPRHVRWVVIPKAPTRIIAPLDMLFDFDKDILKKSSLTALAEIETLLSLRTTLNVEIRGYTDSEGTDSYNRNLSLRRAQVVKDWLIKAKVYGASKFKVTGLGAANPVAPNRLLGKDNPAGRALNRRVEIIYD